MVTYANGVIEEHRLTCSKCGHVFEDGEDMIPVDYGRHEKFFCTSCFDPNNFQVCDNCGKYFHLDSCRSSGRFCWYTNSTHGLCPTCYSEGFQYCRVCRVPSDELNTDDMCPQCAAASELTCIHDHEYVPSQLLFHNTTLDRDIDGDRQLYLGFELEVETTCGTDNSRADMATLINKAGHSWCKHDGSLDCGFEFVSHPMTLRYHRQMDWRGALRSLRTHGYASYTAGTCGCHVHASRDFLPERSWLAISDFVNYGVEARKWYCTIAQRRGNEYAQFYDQLANDADLDEDDARADAVDGENRYMVVNFENTDTIEFRLYKGTLKYESFMSYLEFTDALVRYARFETGELSASRFMAYIKERAELYEELINRLKGKGLWRDE